MYKKTGATQASGFFIRCCAECAAYSTRKNF
jgi:hypothetical protein